MADLELDWWQTTMMKPLHRESQKVIPVPVDESGILWDIARERARQWRKFAAQEPALSQEKVLAVLTEEFLEVTRAVNDHQPWVELRAELVQVSAVCVKFISIGDRRER